MTHHRYIANFEVTLYLPNDPDKSTTALPMPDDLANQVITQIDNALKATKPTKDGDSYEVVKPKKK